MPQPSQSSVRRSGTVAIIGRTNVGKSTFLNAALAEPLSIVTPCPQTTRDRILGVVRHGDSQIALLDTPGFHRPKTRLGRRMNAAARNSVAGVDVAIFMTSVSDKSNEYTKAHPGDLTLLQDVAEGIPTILVVNKIDRWKDKSALLPLLTAYSAARNFAAVIPISARNNNGIDRVLDEVAKLLPERGPVYDEDFLTDKPTRFFCAEYIREQVIRNTEQEVPHSVAVSIERFDETAGEVVHIDAIIRCARAGHRAILVGKGGEKIKQIGIAARARIEALLERQINLKLWVEVNEAWVDSPKALSELGYDSTVNLEEPRS